MSCSCQPARRIEPRKTMRHTRAAAAIALLALVLPAGCGVDAEAEYTPASRRLSSTPELPRPQPTEVLPTDREVRAAPESGTFEVSLAPLGESPLSGQARFTAVGGLTRVSANLRAGARGITYESQIRQGRCDRIGPQVTSLNPITADTLGRGSAASDATIPLSQLVGREHVVVFGPRARPEICGEIPVGSGQEAG